MNVKYPFHKLEVGDVIMINVKTAIERRRVQSAADWHNRKSAKKFKCASFGCGVRIARVA